MQKKEQPIMGINIFKQALAICSLLVFLSAFAGGCKHYQNIDVSRSVYVDTMPPPVKTEATAEQPSKKHTWVDGFWHWREEDKKWVWQKAVWIKPPRAGLNWVEPTYAERADGTVVYSWGYWRSADKEAAVVASVPPAPVKRTAEPLPEPPAEPGIPADGGTADQTADAGAPTPPAEPTKPAEPKK
jgi:hypothetical protein